MVISHGKYPQMLSKQEQPSRSPLRLCNSTESLAIRLRRACGMLLMSPTVSSSEGVEYLVFGGHYRKHYF